MQLTRILLVLIVLCVAVPPCIATSLSDLVDSMSPGEWAILTTEFICIGGSNNGNPCASDTDCSGGYCRDYYHLWEDPGQRCANLANCTSCQAADGSFVGNYGPLLVWSEGDNRMYGPGSTHGSGAEIGRAHV